LPSGVDRGLRGHGRALDQAKHEVAMLLNPSGGVYMEFKCLGELVKARRGFLSPVSPINQLSTTFAATLTRSGATQIPSEYETRACRSKSRP
jgi:hypothetical protein